MPKKENKKEIEKNKKENSNESGDEESSIDDNKFVEFLQPSAETSAPVLEKVENAPGPIDLEQDITASTPDEEKPKLNYTISDELDYSVSEEKIKYQTSMEPPVLQPREVSEDLPRQEFLNPMQGRMIDNQNDLRPRIVEAGFVEKETRLPSETDEKKYKKFEV